jgi:acetyltransferase
MKKTIQLFLESDKVAIAGASPKKENFGRSLLIELQKLGKEVSLVNPKYTEIEGIPSMPVVKDLPGDVENLILAVPPELTEEIVEQSVGSGIKRIWMVRGMGKGAYSEKAHKTCRDNGIEVVYGFCPLMFYGKGVHHFHHWLRTTFGKVPQEYASSE